LTFASSRYLICFGFRRTSNHCIMNQGFITLIGIVDSLSYVIRDISNDLPSKDDVLHRLATLKKELLEAKLREAALAVQAERAVESAIAGIYPAFCGRPEAQKFLNCLRQTLMADVPPPPLPSCSSSRKSVQ